MKLAHLLSIIILMFMTTVSCGGVICKDEKGSVVLDYDPFLNTVDVGGMPTHSSRASWVKKIIVESEGFLVVYDQKTAGFEKQPCKHDKSKMCDTHVIRSVYHIESYTEEDGYKHYSYVPEEDWQKLTQIGDSVPQKPVLHIKNCKFSLIGSWLELLLSLVFASLWTK